MVTSESLDLEDTGMKNRVEFITTRFSDPHFMAQLEFSIFPKYKYFFLHFCSGVRLDPI